MQKKSLETILYSSAGIVVMLAIIIAVNVITGVKPMRVDMTQEKAYTLSDGTKAILKKLDTPVKVRFYCTQSESATPETVYLKSYARKVEDLLAGIQTDRRQKSRHREIRSAAGLGRGGFRAAGRVGGQPLPGAERFYLGLAVSLADERVALPFLEPNRERQLEYDITRAIARVFTPEKPTVGVMSALPVFGEPAIR
jgi:ABC-type uncharacterized transport system involved in gliding motility auxiliary subunit